MNMGGEASALPPFLFLSAVSLVRIILGMVLRRAIQGRSSAIGVLCLFQAALEWVDEI